MISLQIEQKKLFMNQLLLSEYFDAFLLSEAAFVTYSTFHIDGKLQKSYYSSEEQEELHLDEQDYSTWKQIRPFALSLIKGTHTPLSFRIIFRLSKKNTEKLLLDSGLPFTAADVDGLYLNLHFQGQSLTCTTGTSLRTFTLDKSLDHLWDDKVKKYLSAFCS